VNGGDGISDVEGKVARVAMSEVGNERISMEPRGTRVEFQSDSSLFLLITQTRSSFML